MERRIANIKKRRDMMRIPREVIEDVRNRNDIVDVISSYVNLKRAGSNYNGLCPYHNEKTPSFTVFPATQSFYCFGCGAGGDSISFIMKAENLEYIPAVEFLARRVGINLSYSEDDNSASRQRKRILDMNLCAAKYFRACLMDQNVGHIGMKYFSKERGLSMSVIKHFGLGYAPDSFGGLTDHLKKHGFTEEEMIMGFLCGKSKKNGRAYDYFRNRVIFPIIDTSGNVIAFGGRVMDDSKPKYLNSSDTPAFKKSKNLFALNYARHNCSEKMILCEGYMDVIALHAAGFENAVATLGTALTSEQARMMAKYTKQVLIAYDSDEAGQRAATRAVSMLTDVGLDVRILKMNGAKDPDEYIKKFGKDNFRALLDSGRTGFEFKCDSVFAKYDLSIAENKVKAASEMCDYISDIWSEVERDVYITAVATKLQTSREGLKNDVERQRRKKIGEYKNQVSREVKLSAMGVGDRVNPDAAKNIRATAAEEAVLGLMLIYDEYRAGVSSGKYKLTSDDFVTAFNRRVFEEIMQLEENGGYSFSLLGEVFNTDEISRIQSMDVKRRMLTDNGSEVFAKCIEALKEQKMQSSGDAEDGIDAIQKLLNMKRAGLKQEK